MNTKRAREVMKIWDSLQDARTELEQLPDSDAKYTQISNIDKLTHDMTRDRDEAIEL